MEEVFDFFYKLKGFYGPDLYKYLKGYGYVYDDMGFVDKIIYNPDYNQFPAIFICTLAICILIFVLFYYIVNSPRFNRWWSWLISLLIVGALTFGYGYYVINNDIVDGTISDRCICLDQYYDGHTLQIGNINAIMFGIYNSILSMIMFTLLSMMFRHWSRNCKHSPWTSIISRVNRK